MKKSRIVIALSIFVVFLFGIVLGIYLVPEKIIEIENNNSRIIQGSINKEMSIVGVDNQGSGVAAKMSVEVKPGTGLVLVNINNLLADYLTQLSARTASKIASNFTGINSSSLDIIYSIKANAAIIEGPSAGAAMTLATIAALQNSTINNSVFITGTIEENGTIGIVGGIGEKAKAAKGNNASIFLVPAAKYIVGYDMIKECRDLEDIHYCQISYLPKNTNLSKILGMEIIPVNNITEAVKYSIK